MGVDPNLKRFFAEEIRAQAALPDGPETERLLDAFVRVPREAHVQAGPWLLRSAAMVTESRRTQDADPARLYHNVLVALDEAKGINIGAPSLWARFFSKVPIVPGARVLQVGAGSGYFTAILAELTGPTGCVVATEIEPHLADLAEAALAERANVHLIRRDGATEHLPEHGPFDVIVAFAGVTHPTSAWAGMLAPGGTMLLPVTGEDWWGAMVAFRRDAAPAPDLDAIVFTAETLGRCGFFPCTGARDPATERELSRFWSESTRLSGAHLSVTVVPGAATYRDAA